MYPKIAVYGGAFDPPQLAHAAIARGAVELLGLDKLYIVPSGPHRFKTYKIEQEYRRKMSELFALSIGSDRVELCFDFIDGKLLNTTLGTDKYFKEKLGFSPYQIFGTDLVEMMWKWDPTGEVALRLPKILVQRPGCEFDESKIANFIPLNPFDDSVIADLSSTQVRDNVKIGVYDGLNPKIAEYIKENRLYI